MLRLRRPSWFAVVLTLAAVAVFVRLGVWQLDRANQKDALLHLFATESSAPIVPFAKVRHGVADNTYPHVKVRGRFLAGRYYLLDNKTHANRLGVEVYIPFIVADAQRYLLVDLGFLPRTRTDGLPHLPPLPTGATTLRGLYAKAPRPGLKLGGDRLGKQASWPKVSIYLTLADVAKDLDQPFYPRVLLMDPDSATTYVRQWVPDTMPPARHRGYALQWFSFALAAVVLFAVLNRRRPPRKRP